MLRIKLSLFVALSKGLLGTRERTERHSLAAGTGGSCSGVERLAVVARLVATARLARTAGPTAAGVDLAESVGSER
jgi:hypothetical protein